MNFSSCSVCGRAVEVVDEHMVPQTPGIGEGARFDNRLLCKNCATTRYLAHQHRG